LGSSSEQKKWRDEAGLPRQLITLFSTSDTSQRVGVRAIGGTVCLKKKITHRSAFLLYATKYNTTAFAL